MTLPPDLLDRMPEESARLVALSYLDAAARARQRLDDPEDAEALHDFRVSLRRLRSTLRAYRQWLAGGTPGKLRRRLRDLARATSAGRDAEVQLAWLAARRADLTARQRHGCRWLEERVAGRRDAAYTDVRSGVAAGFAKLERRLRDRLSVFQREVRVGSTDPGEAFADVLAGLVRGHAAAFAERMAAIRSQEDDAPAHAARISAKRLRYLLEPVTAPIEPASQAVRRLKRLQDTLGEMHDVHLLGTEIAQALETAAAERARRLHEAALAQDPEDRRLRAELRKDERPGLLALARAARDRRDTLFLALRDEWLAGGTDAFVGEMDRLAEHLGGERHGIIEIERKYLLSALPPEVRAGAAAEIDQGWIPGRRLQERVRRARTPEGERYHRTVKFGAGIKRLELEEEITAAVFDGLWPLTEGRRIRKRRYEIPTGGLVWEVDEFLGRELFLAEIELPSESTAVELPAWLQPYVVREVTGEPEYLNINLAG